ncbi:MAG: DUF1648 domain-containing protein [Dehalococcoidia bacterium]
MKFKFIHPLWTHIPAVLALLAGMSFTLMALPLPDPAPLHFGFDGRPDKFGSPWMSTVWMAGIAILYIILSVMLDENWARQEKEKTFNWIALLDDVTVAALATVQITYVNMLASSHYTYQFPWLETLIAVVLAGGAAALLEWKRSYRRWETGFQVEDVSQVKAEVERIVKAGQPLVYWEVQSPVYSNVLAVVVPVLMVVIGATAWSEVPWLSVFIALIAIAMTLIYGGFRTLVTRENITVRMGMLGIRLLELRTADISAAGVHTFAPLKDFGGYGIRFNRNMRGYFLRGNRGVKITTNAGKNYLIGSDHAERLDAVINAVIA